MDWIQSIRLAVEYIEANLCEDITVSDIAKHACISPYYFQKGFSAVCGISVKEYIRKRRLALAAADLCSGKEKIIDIALKYGYNSPDSFTRAFFKFHNCTPSAARKGNVTVKSYVPIKITSYLKGGYTMEYKIIEKEAFTVAGYAQKFKYENASAQVPVFWKNYFETGKNQIICGKYGINIDKDMGGEKFEYIIADDYTDSLHLPSDAVTRLIPKHTWAVFVCKGPSHETVQKANHYIFTDWLPNNSEYEIAAGINIELYTDASTYPKGVMDENYYGEIWIPVQKK